MWRGCDGQPKRVVMRFDGGAGSCLDRSAWGRRLSRVKADPRWALRGEAKGLDAAAPSPPVAPSCIELAALAADLTRPLFALRVCGGCVGFSDGRVEERPRGSPEGTGARFRGAAAVSSLRTRGRRHGKEARHAVGTRG